MAEQDESISKLSFLDQATIALKETGVFNSEVTAQELAQIMSGVITSLTAGQEAVKASVPTMDVQIEKSMGTIQGEVIIERPIRATIGVNFTLANDVKPQTLRLVSLGLQKQARGLAKLALGAMNIDVKVKDALSDPNQILGRVLGTQLQAKDVQLTGLGLHFNEKNLAVSLTGHPVQVNK